MTPCGRQVVIRRATAADRWGMKLGLHPTSQQVVVSELFSGYAALETSSNLFVGDVVCAACGVAIQTGADALSLAKRLIKLNEGLELELFVTNVQHAAAQPPPPPPPADVDLLGLESEVMADTGSREPYAPPRAADLLGGAIFSTADLAATADLLDVSAAPTANVFAAPTADLLGGLDSLEDRLARLAPAAPPAEPNLLGACDLPSAPNLAGLTSKIAQLYTDEGPAARPPPPAAAAPPAPNARSPQDPWNSSLANF